MVSEATKMAVIGNMQMDTKDIVEVIEHHRPISHSPCRRRSIGPLPSCFMIERRRRRKRSTYRPAGLSAGKKESPERER